MILIAAKNNTDDFQVFRDVLTTTGTWFSMSDFNSFFRICKSVSIYKLIIHLKYLWQHKKKDIQKHVSTFFEQIIKTFHLWPLCCWYYSKLILKSKLWNGWQDKLTICRNEMTHYRTKCLNSLSYKNVRLLVQNISSVVDQAIVENKVLLQCFASSLRLYPEIFRRFIRSFVFVTLKLVRSEFWIWNDFTFF